MPPARDVGASNRHSWRGVSGPADPQAARRVRRVLWAGAFLALLACFGWLLVHYSGPTAVVRAVVLTVGDYDVLQAPPLPFAQETLEEFAPLGERELAEVTTPEDVTTSNALRSFFSQELPRKVVEPDRDVLVVYLAAHGVTQCDETGGVEAWLLCSNYDPLRKEGMVRLDDLLADLAACRGQTKLLLLDAGEVESDLALGMAANEFAAVLGEKLAKLDDPNLWVLLSHDQFERSHAAHADRRSVFGYYVARGLAGGADQDANGVDLAELAAYVRKRVASYVWQASAEAATQTPSLMVAGPQTGAAMLALASQRKLTPYRPLPAAEPAPAEPAKPASKPEANKTALRPFWNGSPSTVLAAQAPAAPASEPPAADPAKPAAADAPAAAAEEKKSSPAKPAQDGGPSATDSPQPKADAKPAEAPPAGDNVAKPVKSAKAAKPVRRSPWEQSLFDQWQKAAGFADRQATLWTPNDYAPHLWLRSLELLKGYEFEHALGAGSEKGQAERRLAEVWNDFDESERRQRFETSVARSRLEQHRDLMAAVQLRNELCLRLRYYIPFAAGDGEEALGDVGALLDNLAELMQELRNPPEPGAAGAESSGARTWLAKLRDLHDQLADRAARLDERWRAQLAAEISPGANRGRNAFAIEPLLNLPWLSADERAQLLDRQSNALRLKDAADRDAPRDNSRLETRARQKALSRSKLEARRLQLAGVALSEETAASSPSPDALRELAARLAKAVRALPEAVAKAADAENEATRRAAEDLLRLADVRSAQRLDASLGIDGVDPPTAYPYPDLGIVWQFKLSADLAPPAANSSAVAVTLKTEGPTTIAWRLEAAPPAAAEAKWSLDYDRALVEVSPASSGELPLAPDRNDLPLKFAIKPKAETGQLVSITLRAAIGERSATHRIDVRLPNLDPVELVLGEPAGLAGNYERVDDRRLTKIVLHPLASGRSEFRLGLKNPAGRERKIKYRLLALNRSGVPDALLAAWPLAPSGELAEGYKPLYPAPQTLTVPAGKTIALPLPPLPAAAPGDKTPGDKAPAANQPPAADKPPAAAAPPGTPIPDGLVCEFIDATTEPPGATQRYWLAVAPIHPRQYLAEPEVKYDWDDKQIVILIRPRDVSLLPAAGVKVQWRCEDPLLREAKPSTVEGVLSREAPQLKLFAAVEPLKDRPLEVLLDVDGYPRSFLYDVWCDRPRGAAPAKLFNFAVLNIVEPQANPTWLADGAPATLKLRLDVPPGWFDQPGRLLKTGILGDERESRNFSSDRLFGVRLLPAAAEGELALETSVSDLEATFNTASHPNQDIELAAELTETNLVDQRTIKLDRDPPEFRLERVNPKAPRGQELVVQIPVSDARSRVAKVEVGIDRDGTGELKQPVQATASKSGKDLFVATLPTKELPIGDYTALVRAVDLVGNASKAAKFPFEITRPAGDAMTAKKTARFNGKVSWNDRPAKGFTVIAAGPKSETVKADGNGAFTFAELPPGEYKLTFKGVMNNREVEFSEPLTIAPPTAKPQEKTFNGR